MSKREAFLAAACKSNVEDFLRYIQLHNDKTDPFDVEEVIQEMPKGQRGSLWGKLSSLLKETLEGLPPECWNQAREEAMEVESNADPKHVMAVVEGVTIVATVSVKVLEDGNTYNALLEIAHQLHDVLVSLEEPPTHMRLHILTLFEAWWKKGLQDKEKFGLCAFLTSLQKSFVLKKAGPEIQRVWNLHEVLMTVDYASEDSKLVIDLLLRCLQYPFYYSNDEGKKFLMFLFTWNVNFIWVIHGTIKNQLGFFKETTVNHVTAIYYRAWKKASGDFLETIESSCIQDLMQNAILLNRASPVISKVRQILHYFHARKSYHRVEKMLCILYKPILWKALSAPNFEVRANATFLFTDAFPVHDPDQDLNLDETIQKQLDTVMSLLNDPHPCVRCIATLGVCKILDRFWKLLPAAVITDFLKKLVTEMANDTSSPDVRCSVFKSLNIVIDNSLSHPVLEKLLPALKYSLHDTSEKVRVAFLDMLIKVKAARAAKFWELCSIEHLLARLATDSQPVSKRLVELLFKSFFPIDKSEREWCSRCITLIQMNPKAARKFYQNAYKHTAATNICKLMLAIRRLLNSCIEGELDITENNDTNKENSPVRSDLLGNDVALVSGLLEVVVILWRTIESSLKKNAEAQKYACAKFGTVIGKYFSTFKDEQCSGPLIELAAFLPPKEVPTFSCSVLSRLRKMDSGALAKQYSQLLDCMCTWGRAADVLGLITDWLNEALPKQAEKAHTNRKVRVMDNTEAKPDLALAYLDYLLLHPSTLEKVLACSKSPLKQVHTALGKWKSALHTHLHSTTDDPSHPKVEVALKAFSLHCRLSAHLQHDLSEGRDFLLSLEHVAVWVIETVLPFLGECNHDNAVRSLAAQITETFLKVCRDVILIDLGDKTFKDQILQLCSLIILSKGGYLCIHALLPVLKEVAEIYAVDNNSNGQEDPQDEASVTLGVLANIFQKIIELLAGHLKKEPEKGKLLCQSLLSSLTDFLQVAKTCDRTPLNGVFSTLFAVVIVEKRQALQKIALPEELNSSNSVEDMPPLSSMLLSAILTSAPITRAFLKEACSSLDSGAISNLSELTAVLQILAVIRPTGQAQAPLKYAATCIQQLLLNHAVATGDCRDMQRVMYESSVKTLQEILD